MNGHYQWIILPLNEVFFRYYIIGILWYIRIMLKI